MSRLLALFLLFGVDKEAVGPTPAPHAAKKRLRTPSYISPVARKLLDERMEHHAEAAMRLSMSVVLLEYGETWEAAQQIADQAGLARPKLGEEGTLNTALPQRFFDLQDQLRARARDLVKAASEKNDQSVSVAYGKLMETCVACHAVYLNGRGSEEAKRERIKEIEQGK